MHDVNLRTMILALLLFAIACQAPPESSESPQPPASPAPPSGTVEAPPPVETSSPDVPDAPPETRLPPVRGPKLMPRDEGERDASFAEFRRTLLDTVQRKDASALRSVLDPKIRTSFGTDGGLDDFERRWKPSDRDSKLWPQLETILTLGGTFRGEGADRMFWTPYVFSTWPESIDAFTHVAVIRERVILREAPRADAKGIAILSYDIVATKFDPDNRWREIETADGRRGFVPTSDIRSSLDYRAGFRKTGGKWTMSVLIAGD